MDKRDIAAVTSLLSTPQSILITTHQRPDGDAMGSSLGLLHFLKKNSLLTAGLQHDVHFISPTAYPQFISWLPGNEDVLVYESNKEKAAQLIRKATLVFCLDFNKLYRIEALGEEIGKSAATKILIDHHLEPDAFATYSFCDTKASSTCELVYQFIHELGRLQDVDVSIATCLYTGLLTDTDRFRIPTTSPAVHRMAAALLEKEIDHTAIYSRIYETFSENRLKLFGYCLWEKMEVIPELRAGIITLEHSELKRFNAQLGDTEGLVNYPLWMKDVVVSALITPKKDAVKLSLRSKGNFSVEAICRQHFGGGGHRNASGGTSGLSVLDTKEKLISIFALLKNELNSVEV